MRLGANAMNSTEQSHPDFGRFGVFCRNVTPERARIIEALGYGTIWVGGTLPADKSIVGPLMETTTSLTVVTGIANIWTAPAASVAESFHDIESAHPGRFVLSLGVGHPEIHTQYRKPYTAMYSYLDQLDQYKVPAHQLLLAAFGPRLLKLSAERCAGAHPYLTTPQHTTEARQITGPSALLAPAQKVVLTRDTHTARALGRRSMRIHLELANYVNSWKRFGFSDKDVAKPGSDTLIDALVAHGTLGRVVAHLDSHLQAGADHVAIQVLGGDEQLMPTLSALAARFARRTCPETEP